jgi:adenylate kinase family enzyme
VGYPGSGKSTFATAMRAPILAIDSDHRFNEVAALAAGDVFQLSDKPSDQVDADAITRLLAASMPGADVATIVIDSLTAIITPLVVQAMIDKDAGRAQNLAAAFKTKALAMRQLQDAVTRWGVDTLWVYHLSQARDAHAKEVVRTSVSATERARLVRSINLQLELVQDGQRRGVKVAWSRRGRAGMVLWDQAGDWKGMPERIEATVYGGLSIEDQDAIEHEAPAVFASPALAIAWGLERGAFEALPHARNAYTKLRKEKQPATAAAMRDLWVADVARRLEEMAA